MNFSSVPPTLAQLDALRNETLILAHFADERPLRGVGGLVDWRLNGKLSRMILKGRLTGAWGEQLLYPQKGRLPFTKLIYFGLGDRSKFGSTRFKEVTNRMLRTVMRLGCFSFATCLPGRDVLKLVPRQLIDLWLGELQRVFISQRFHDLEYDVVFLEPADVRTEMDEQLAQFKRHHSMPMRR